MSDTPRTDACEKIATRRHGYYDRFAIARELESELAEAKEQRDRLANHVHALAHLLAAVNQQFLHSAAVTQDIQKALAAVKGGTL
jgi:hypothetical protein